MDEKKKEEVPKDVPKKDKKRIQVFFGYIFGMNLKDIPKENILGYYELKGDGGPGTIEGTKFKGKIVSLKPIEPNKEFDDYYASFTPTTEELFNLKGEKIYKSERFPKDAAGNTVGGLPECEKKISIIANILRVKYKFAWEIEEENDFDVLFGDFGQIITLRSTSNDIILRCKAETNSSDNSSQIRMYINVYDNLLFSQASGEQGTIQNKSLDSSGF